MFENFFRKAAFAKAWSIRKPLLRRLGLGGERQLHSCAVSPCCARHRSTSGNASNSATQSKGVPVPSASTSLRPVFMSPIRTNGTVEASACAVQTSKNAALSLPPGKYAESIRRSPKSAINSAPPRPSRAEKGRPSRASRALRSSTQKDSLPRTARRCRRSSSLSLSGNPSIQDQL
jgi:hypothetical protein